MVTLWCGEENKSARPNYKQNQHPEFVTRFSRHTHIITYIKVHKLTISHEKLGYEVDIPVSASAVVLWALFLYVEMFVKLKNKMAHMKFKQRIFLMLIIPACNINGNQTRT